MKTARLLVTQKCLKNCPGCCNKDIGKLYPVEHIHHVELFRSWDYDIVCITGGEPLLDWDNTKYIINKLRKSGIPTIYLYTAMYIDKMYEVVEKTEGIQYTIHHPPESNDIRDFYKFQTIIEGKKNKSFRLYIDSRVDIPIVVKPNVWKRVEVKAWMKECPLPKDEKLFIYYEI